MEDNLKKFEYIKRITFVLSEYPRYNDDLIKKCYKIDKVRVKKYNGFIDLKQDPDLSEEQGKKGYSKCVWRRDVKVFDKKLYGCCISEPLERHYKTDPVHKMLDKNWKENWLQLPVWKVCMHCNRNKEIKNVQKNTHN